MSELAVKRESLFIFPAPVAEQSEENVCGICLDNNDLTTFNHDNDLPHRGWHKKCILEWMQKNPKCPECSIPIAYSFESRTEKTSSYVTSFTKKLSYGASIGLEYAFNPHVFAALTAGSVLHPQKILTVLGAGSVFSSAFGIGARFLKSEEAATQFIAKYSHLGSLVASGILSILVSNFSNEDYLRGIGALAILHNAGKKVVEKGALISTAAAGAILPTAAYFPLEPVSILAAQLGGAAGALFRSKTEMQLVANNHQLVTRKVPLLITGFSMATGWAVSRMTARYFSQYHPIAGALIGAATGGAFAAATSELLDQGHASYKQWGFALV